MRVERDYVDGPSWDSFANVIGMDYHRHRVHSRHHFICDEVSCYRHCVVLADGCCYLADCSLCFCVWIWADLSAINGSFVSPLSCALSV